MTETLTPVHVACIMDGNGRWAKQRGLERVEGHDAGEEAITATVDAALEEGIAWLSLFAFSTENWSRPDEEVAFLMEFNRRLISKYGEPYHRRGVRFRYLGHRHAPIPQPVRDAMDAIERRTQYNRTLTLTFAFNHGGRAEVVDAVRRLVDADTPVDAVTEEAITEHLQYADMPDPDLIIRTSGEHRLSNFMLWRAAYAELVFPEVLWPDFRGEHLRDALVEYRRRQRRFGAIA